MTDKQFLQNVSNSKEDILQILLNRLADVRANYCIIGGLAVNAYTDPVVSLDMDIIIASKKLNLVCNAVKDTLKIEQYEHSINLSSKKSDLRIQFQTDLRYQDFIKRAEARTVLGYEMKVACVEDVLQGKIWAYSDEQRRKSKRQKDLADIVRLVESHPHLSENMPMAIRNKIEL